MSFVRSKQAAAARAIGSEEAIVLRAEEQEVLIRRAQSGDGEAFIELISLHKDRLFRSALAYLSEESEAIEALDEALFRAWQSISTLRQPPFFLTWLTRILINCCLKILQRRQREQTVADIPETSAEDFDALPLRDAVAHLSEELRLIISLRFFADLTVAETAAVLEIPEGTVKTRQRRALSLLRLEWEEE